MDYYGELSSGYNKLYGEEQLKKARIIREHIAVRKVDKLLDVGCGTGISSELFDCEKTGIDPSAEMIKQASFPVMQGRAEQLPFPDSSFDIVLCMTAVHNFDDIKTGLEEIKRVAKGAVAITVLKKSVKSELIEKLIRQLFKVRKVVNSEKDKIFILNAKSKS